jgi:hypothetical protein
MKCKVSLCDRCIKSVSQGEHTEHELQDFDDAIAHMKKMVTTGTIELKDIESKASQLCDKSASDLSAWKSDLDKTIAERTWDAIMKVHQWKTGVCKKVQGIYKERTDQIQQIRNKFSSGKLWELEKMPTLEAFQRFDNYQQLLDKLASELKGYHSARLVPQDSLTGRWSMELGEIQSKQMVFRPGPTMDICEHLSTVVHLL